MKDAGISVPESRLTPRGEYFVSIDIPGTGTEFLIEAVHDGLYAFEHAMKL